MSWRKHFENASADLVKYPAPWESRAEVERGRIIYYALDANGKFVGELPRKPGQTSKDHKSEFDSIINRVNIFFRDNQKTSEQSIQSLSGNHPV